jgi:3-oxoacyl-[acyl-carrier protein] reductase
MPTILITGATGGIGSVLSETLASRGNDLILSARNVESLMALGEKLTLRYGVRTFPLVTDLSDWDSLAAAAEKMKEMPCAIEGVVIMPPRPQPGTDALPTKESWEQLFRTSFVGPLELLKSALPLLMRGDGRKKIVLVSGVSSAQVMSHYATANVLRTAWLGQAKTLAFALGASKIHFNTVSLGGVMTERYADGLRGRAASAGRTFDEQIADEVSNIPLGKYATPQEVADAIEALLGKASDHMTGMNIMIDGGFTRSY